MLSILWMSQRPQCKCNGNRSKTMQYSKEKPKCISNPSLLLTKWKLIAQWGRLAFLKTNLSSAMRFKVTPRQSTKIRNNSWQAPSQLSHWPMVRGIWIAVRCARISCKGWMISLLKIRRWNGVRHWVASKNLAWSRTSCLKILIKEISSSEMSCLCLKIPTCSRHLSYCSDYKFDRIKMAANKLQTIINDRN